MMNTKLSLSGVSRQFGDGEATITILDNLSFAIKEGEFVAVVGPSGSGKSTFLSIAGALLTPSAGEVVIDGKRLDGLSGKELARLRLSKIGFMFQSANLIPYLKVEEQLMFVAKLAGMDKREAKRRAGEMLSRLGLESRKDYYPEKLSGGEKQRAAIARAWMNKPAILLADEPTASLDASRGQDVVRMIAEEVKQERKAAVMVTHDERMLHYCDRVVRLQDGKLVE